MIGTPHSISDLLSHTERGEPMRAHVPNRGRRAVARAEHDDRLIEERARQQRISLNFG
jgi:hypothetical protein